VILEIIRPDRFSLTLKEVGRVIGECFSPNTDAHLAIAACWKVDKNVVFVKKSRANTKNAKVI